MNKIYGRCEVLSWPDFDNDIHALPDQIQKQDAAMKYNGSFYIDKKLATGRIGKYRERIKLCTCPEIENSKLHCPHMYIIALNSKANKINRFLHYLK